MHLSDPTVPHQFAGVAESSAAALLASGLPYPLVTMDRVSHRSGLANRTGKRFFAVNIEPRLGGSDSGYRMPLVRKRHDHRVKIAAPDQLAEVQVSLGVLRFVPPVDRPEGPVELGLVNVAGG
jgi:hypothetical protein